MKRNATLAVVCALAVGGIAAGCGSSDGSDNATAAATIPLSEYLAKADQICKEADAQLDKAGSALGEHPSKAQLTDFSNDTVVPSIQGQIDDVRGLGTPSTEEEQVSAFLTTAQGAVNRLKADPSLVVDDSVFSETSAKANAAGFKVCAH
jgi:hypothetical protein